MPGTFVAGGRPDCHFQVVSRLRRPSTRVNPNSTTTIAIADTGSGQAAGSFGLPAPAPRHLPRGDRARPGAASC